jgi:hypothetical protein
VNMVWDGLFHAVVWLVTLVGVQCVDMHRCAYRLPRLRKADPGGKDGIHGRGHAPATRRPGMGRIPGPVLNVAAYVPCSEGNSAASGRLAKLPRAKGHITSMLWGSRGFKGRGGLQPVALQKQLQGGPAGSPHGASPALNALPVRVDASPSTSRQHSCGSFPVCSHCRRGVSLVPYPPFRRVGICNLASGVEWHGVSQSGWWNLSRLYTIAHVCTSTEGISRARKSNRSEDNGRLGRGVV